MGESKLGGQIAKIYRISAVLARDKTPFERPFTLGHIELEAGVDAKELPHYLHQAFYCQNFMPRIELKIEERRTRVVKKGFPPAYDLYFKPEEAVLLRLFELGAYGKSVHRNGLKLDANEQLRQLEKSGLVSVKEDEIQLTKSGMTEAFDVMSRYDDLRGDCFADLRSFADKLKPTSSKSSSEQSKSEK